MEDSRRRQLHSCDPCRKGKRGCDAPKDRQKSTFSTCSNCTRWKKECTFNWISSKRVDSRGSRKRIKTNTTKASVVGSHDEALEEILRSAQTNPADLGELPELLGSPETSDYASSSSSSHPENHFLESFQTQNSSDDQPQLFPWTMNIPYDLQINNSRPNGSPDSAESDALLDLAPSSVDSTYSLLPQQEYTPTSDLISTVSTWKPSRQKHPSESASDRSSDTPPQWNFCIASENTAKQSARATMSRNLVRIYHDSMENALSCWLTEHNCPYSDSISQVVPDRGMKEWGPNWSNRMCIRVCQLDRVSSSIRGRALSAEEDTKAARALHLAIMSFASQWAQHAQKGTSASVPSTIDNDERSIRQKVWNEARHALEHSSSIPSFRIAFANIIFSLTQSPLDKGQETSLGELLENDRAPIFLESANRQIFTFRHKFTRLQREAAPKMRGLGRGPIDQTTANVLGIPQPSEPPLDPLLTSHEHRTTLDLMFWLGVMFDTLSAAMYQRPLVVSDEDSQISTTSPIAEPRDQINFDPWNIPSNARGKEDVWGDLFLRSSIQRQGSSQIQPRWPCSYEEAASILSEATPVKVLLYRRVTQLQTMVYRGASPEHIENIIQETLLVCQHWDSTYQSFMVDCVTNHELLPSRIQSWYVILDGHWHLATMLLADVLESIDKCKLGSDLAREARQTTHLVATLRMNNALAVGGLARASIQGQESFMNHHFHDSLSEVAFLVEPWTAVLVHCFAKAGYILVENLDVPTDQNMYTECFRQNCEFLIRALQYLGRKSDMAFLVARSLLRSLESKLA
ncbi:transcriptional regulator family: Fungal Specific TF [Penicillium psychrosexuale]|uniref:transcriptional regulator family: Fungal Specific TF n=1 Tax=Penicillium psychrosexuale TaxID=1002107 RepID=UPI0025452873|nr:transcriptional regulator family: Fungal Specific TF [Penicillium psychrosexuale]KAJ5800555.1 transcriptional regulator family: Fungal Specific TF [Penicillium psychrosexuale]